MNKRVYYISITAGDDSNDGSSPDTPLKSMERVAKLSLKAGDELLFKCGDIWYGTTTLDLSQGEEENPIILASYGEGEKPSFRYYEDEVLEKQTNFVFILKNANGVEIRNLDIGYANAGIQLEYSTINHRYVRIEECHFHDIYGTMQLDGLHEILPFSAGIWTSAAGLRTTDYKKNGYPLTDMYIHKCTTYDAGSLTGYNDEVNNLYITECVGQNNAYYGCVVTADGGYVDRCVFDSNGTRPMIVGSCGIMIAADNYTLKNSVISNQKRLGNDPDGCGIDFEWKCRKVTVENMLIENSAGVGIMFFTSGNKGHLGENRGTNIDCVVQNCKFVNNNLNMGEPGGSEIYCVAAATMRCVIQNNQYVVDKSTGTQTASFEMVLEPQDNDILFLNNIQVEKIDKDFNPLF